MTSPDTPHPDKQAKDIPTMVKAKHALKKKMQVVPQGNAGELPHILNINGSNTCLAGHPIPAGLQEKVTAYEQRMNHLEEKLGDLAAKFVQLESENQSMHAWYMGCLILVWEGLHQLGEQTTRLLGAMVKVVVDDNAKHKHFLELMEEAQLCLGIPYTSYQGPVRGCVRGHP